MSGLYSQNLSFSPARAVSSQIRTNPDFDNQYLAELLAERQKLGPFMQVFPVCCRLLDQEILRVSGMIANQRLNVYGSLQHGRPSPMASLDMMTDVGGKGLGSWKGFQNERLPERQEMTIDWPVPPGSPGSYTVKKVLRLEIPVEKYPNFNFVGRLLGPRGNSLKRVEASTGCRIFIRGQGSIKDTDKEDTLRGRPGYEHLSDPLHVLIEAELPINVIDVQLKQAKEIVEELLTPVAELPINVIDVQLKQAKEIVEELLTPVDESQDFYKRQQLKELALINNTFREESPQTRGSLSPFSSPGMKRAKPGWE